MTLNFEVHLLDFGKFAKLTSEKYRKLKLNMQYLPGYVGLRLFNLLNIS